MGHHANDWTLCIYRSLELQYECCWDVAVVLAGKMMMYSADVLQQGLKPNMTEWLTSCLQVAAACRFEAVDASSDRNVRGLPGAP